VCEHSQPERVFEYHPFLFLSLSISLMQHGPEARGRAEQEELREDPHLALFDARLEVFYQLLFLACFCGFALLLLCCVITGLGFRV